MTAELRILFLDDLGHYERVPGFTAQLSRPGVHVTSIKTTDIVPPADSATMTKLRTGETSLTELLFSGDMYVASGYAKELACTALPNDYDLVVVGNNMGEGVVLAELLHRDLQAQTVIVSYSTMRADDRIPYETLGFRRFIARDRLNHEIARLIDASEPRTESNEQSPKPSTGRRPSGLPHRFAETYQSLRVYAALIAAGRPLMVKELMELTGIADGTLYPLIQKREAVGLMVSSQNGKSAQYDLTPRGYETAKTNLLALELTAATWIAAEHKFTAE
jgi:hypothetical protein